MKIEFDPDKDTANQKKHGLSLADTERMDFATASIKVDSRYDYGEVRRRALGLIDGRLHFLVFTMREDNVRAISLRKASLREVKRYDEEA